MKASKGQNELIRNDKHFPSFPTPQPSPNSSCGVLFLKVASRHRILGHSLSPSLVRIEGRGQPLSTSAYRTEDSDGGTNMTDARDTEPLDCSKPHSSIEGNLEASQWGPACVWNGVSYEDGAAICANHATYVCVNGVWKCQQKRC
jgi:hypothetical protein